MRISEPATERRILHAFGPKSSLAELVLTELAGMRRQLPDEVLSIVQGGLTDDSEGIRDEVLIARLYLSLISRGLLLEAFAVHSLSELPWGYPSHTPDLRWLDAIGQEAAESQVQDAVREGLLCDPDRTGDPFRVLFESFIPLVVRKRRGEHYTPDWLADEVVDGVWGDELRWLDPTVGVGSFALAVLRAAHSKGFARAEIVGIEQETISFVAAAAAIAWACRVGGRLPDGDARIFLMHGNVLEVYPPAGLDRGFDRIVGNPPWVLWDRYSADERLAMGPLWTKYGLRTEWGIRSILGGGKRDVATLVALVAADRWLSRGGQMSMVFPASVFHSSSSARGFRKFVLPDGDELGVERVDDFSRLRVFPKANVKALVARIRKGCRTQYPVDYFEWGSRRRDDAVRRLAGPSEEDPTSAWSCVDVTSDGGWSIEGRCEYEIHLGVNTGGAGGVYWLRKVCELPGDVWRMQNLSDRGRRNIAAMSVELESAYLFPHVLGRDVRRWVAEPSAWILFVQDVERRRGIDEAVLSKRGPRVLRYLRMMEEPLRARAALRRYFTRTRKDGSIEETGPFYSMFNVGRYTLSRWKVAWNRMGHQMAVAVLGTHANRLILPQETHAFIGVESETESWYLSAVLNSPWVQSTLRRYGSGSSKSFATPGAVGRIRIARFDDSNSLHRRLSELGQLGSKWAADVGQLRAVDEEIRRTTAVYWEIGV